MIEWLRARSGVTHLCGHRGHSIGAPENTLAALAATIDHGGTTAEIDTLLTRDGEIILLHDQTLDRTTNARGPANLMTLAEIKALDAGAWFSPRFASERVPTLAEALRFAQAQRLGLVVEIKETQDKDAYLARMADVLAETGGLGQIMLISFDHVDLKRAKERIAGVKTEGITHARHADPVGVARSAGLDSLSIEWPMFRREDAEALHAAGVAIRCHMPRPDWFAAQAAIGRDPRPAVVECFVEGLFDSVSGDDVGFLNGMAAEADRFIKA